MFYNFCLKHFSCKVPVILVRFYWTLNFLDRFSGKKIVKYQICWKSVGVELIHADRRWEGQKDRHGKNHSKGKIKCTLVQTLRLCTGRTAHRGSRGIALPFLDHDTRSVTPRPLFTPWKDRYPLYRRLGGPQGPRCGKSRSHRDSIPGPSSP